MSVWERYSKEQQEEYKDFLSMYGALSAMFNQKSSETGAPYLDSKFQETIYARSFESEDVDIGNTPHDIMSVFGENEKVGIGIKTWLNSAPSYQKVMQLKRYKNEIDPFNSEKTKEELAYKIATIKNDRLRTDYKRLGLPDQGNIYHYVTRDKGMVKLQETDYPLVDLDTLKPGDLTATSFSFSDRYKQYRYTFGDSQIWMRFGENGDFELLDTINIEILDDPFAFLKDAFTSKKGVLVPNVTNKLKAKDYIYLPLYSYRKKEVLESSGLNAWNGKPKSKDSQTVRPKGEAYIPIPKILWEKCPTWFDKNVDMRDYDGYKKKTGKNSYTFKLHMPDGKVFDALVGQAGFKALQTNPQSVLGKWILDVIGIDNPQRERYDKPAEKVVTMDLLWKKGFDSVKLWHEDPNNPQDVWIDFADIGAFERFMDDEVIETGEDISE